MINQRIKELRKQRGLSMAQLGAKIGVAASTIHKWESGSIESLRANKLPTLAKALGTTIEYLMGYTDDPHQRLVPQMKTEEEAELSRVYSSLDLRRRNRLLAYAWELEQETMKK